MNQKRAQKFLSLFLLTGLVILFEACCPSVRTVANALDSIPIGISREQLETTLIAALGKHHPNRRFHHGLTSFVRPVTASILKADKELVAFLKSDHRYVRIFPPNLYENFPLQAFTEPIGMVAEASEGNGSVSLYYDGKTNYIGYLAYTSGTDY
jgi:hypothetical protein